MVVKVQISQFSSDGIKHMYIYDKSRKFVHEGIATEDVLAVMDNKPKLFFKAEVVGKRFRLLKKVDWQDW